MFKPTHGEGTNPQVSVICGTVTMLPRLFDRILAIFAPQTGSAVLRRPADVPLQGRGFNPWWFVLLVKARRRAYDFLDRPFATRLAGHFSPRACAELGIAAHNHDLGRQSCADFYQSEVRSLAAQRWALTSPANLLRRAMPGLPAARRAIFAN